MSKDAKPAQKRIDQFFSGPGGRADDWRDWWRRQRRGPEAEIVRNTMRRSPISP